MRKGLLCYVGCAEPYIGRVGCDGVYLATLPPRHMLIPSRTPLAAFISGFCYSHVVLSPWFRIENTSDPSMVFVALCTRFGDITPNRRGRYTDVYSDVHTVKPKRRCLFCQLYLGAS